MRTLRLLLAVLLIAALVVPQASGAVPTRDRRGKLLDKPPIRIVNDAPFWRVRVWAYRGGATDWEWAHCQFLDWGPQSIRHIEPWEDREFGWEAVDHCGNFDTLTFWFEMWNVETGAHLVHKTFGKPTPWGATWRWDGRTWILELDW